MSALGEAWDRAIKLHVAQAHLADFGLRVLRAYRGDKEPPSLASDELDRLGLEAGVLAPQPVTQACSVNCACALFGGIPGACLRVADDIQPLMKE